MTNFTTLRNEMPSALCALHGYVLISFCAYRYLILRQLILDITFHNICALSLSIYKGIQLLSRILTLCNNIIVPRKKKAKIGCHKWEPEFEKMGEGVRKGIFHLQYDMHNYFV